MVRAERTWAPSPSFEQLRAHLARADQLADVIGLEAERLTVARFLADLLE